jgi:Putative undecaprenyl diphosphate synthase
VDVALEMPLLHMMVVAGTLPEWDVLGEDRWSRRVDELGRVVSDAGGRWLTIRAYEQGGEAVDLTSWTRVVGGCEILVDPCGDGRRRFAEAMAALDPIDEVNEATVASVLYAPAEAEPDLVLILGPSTQLPPSLVWELAYAELVFLEVGWDELAADHLVRAIDDFAGRRRRFGGLDDGRPLDGDDE